MPSQSLWLVVCVIEDKIEIEDKEFHYKSERRKELKQYAGCIWWLQQSFIRRSCAVNVTCVECIRVVG